MNFWKYKAFNDQKMIVEDVAVCSSFNQLAFALRQKGLQIIEATSIQRSEYESELRLKKMKVRVNTPSPIINNKQLTKKVKRKSLIYRILSLFGW